MVITLFDIDGMLIFAASLDDAIKFANQKQNNTNETNEN